MSVEIVRTTNLVQHPEMTYRRTIRVIDYETTVGEGRRVISDVTKDIYITVQIDQIAKTLGGKAVRSKGGKSVDGHVVVKVKRQRAGRGHTRPSHWGSLSRNAPNETVMANKLIEPLKSQQLFELAQRWASLRLGNADDTSERASILCQLVAGGEHLADHVQRRHLHQLPHGAGRGGERKRAPPDAPGRGRAERLTPRGYGTHRADRRDD